MHRIRFSISMPPPPLVPLHRDRHLIQYVPTASKSTASRWLQCQEISRHVSAPSSICSATVSACLLRVCSSLNPISFQPHRASQILCCGSSQIQRFISQIQPLPASIYSSGPFHIDLQQSPISIPRNPALCFICSALRSTQPPVDHGS